MDTNETTLEAARYFCEEMEHLHTVSILREAGNHVDANGFQDTADMCLDMGWNLLENLDGWRPRDIAKFRNMVQSQYMQKYHA